MNQRSFQHDACVKIKDSRPSSFFADRRRDAVLHFSQRRHERNRQIGRSLDDQLGGDAGMRRYRDRGFYWRQQPRLFPLMALIA